MTRATASAPPLAAWGIDAPLVLLAGQRRAPVLRTAPGVRPALVFKPTSWSVPALDWLGPVEAAARRAGFVVPRRWPTRSGAPQADGWICRSFVDAYPAGPEDLDRIAPQIAAFHRFAAVLPQRPGMIAAADLQSGSRCPPIDMTVLPRPLALACRAAWAELVKRPRTVVHGDLNSANLLWDHAGHPILIDWETARRDCPDFDLEPVSALVGLGARTARNARIAWEIASFWRTSPDYARALVPLLWS